MTDTRLTDLKRKLAARERNPAFAENVAELKREIERLEPGAGNQGDDQ